MRGEEFGFELGKMPLYGQGRDCSGKSSVIKGY